MADDQKVIELVFQGVDKTAAATQAALKNAEKFTGNIQSATQPIADFTANAVKLEAGLLAAGVAVTAFSVKVASDFQSSVVDLQKVLGENENIQEYRDLALELGEAYGVASGEVLQSIANYKQAGFSAQEAAQLTKSGLDIVIAGSVEATTAADLLVASIKGFGAEASDSAVIVDLLNAVSNEYAASTSQLLEGFSVLSPVAKAAGLSLQETVGILTPGIEVFQSGSEVANALRTSLLRLVDDSKPVQEGLAALGVSQKDANGELRSARDIYFDVAAALQGVDENQKLYIASQLVGINRSSEFLAITDGLDKTLRIAGDGFDYVGSAAKEVAAQLATAESAGNRAKVAFENLFIGIGTPFLDEFSGTADAITAIFQAMGASIQDGEGGIASLLQYVESQFATLEATLATVAQNLPQALEQADFSGFIGGLDAVGEAVSFLFDGADLTSVEGLATAITTVGVAFEGLSEYTGGVIKSFRPLFETITEVGGGLRDLNPNIFETVGSLFGFVEQANLLAGGINSLLPAIEALVGLLIARQSVSLVGGLAAAGTAIGGAGGLISLLGAAGLAGAAGAAGAAIGTLVNDGIEKLSGTSLSTALVDFLINIGLIDDEATALAESLEAVGNAPLGRITPELTELDDSVARFAESLDQAKDGIFELAEGQTTIEGLTPFYDLVTGKVIGYAEVLKEAASESQALGEATGAAADGARRLGADGAALTGTLSFVKNELSGVADAANKLGEATAEISLEEKIALIESQTAIATASIEADAQKIEAAFGSVNTTIEQSSETVRELFGLFGDENISKLDKFKIQDQIEKENERIDKANELQARLTEATIREMNARAEALANGGALLTIDGAGLQPHLEAFMFEILRSIQVRVNAEGYEFLLGGT